MKKGLRTEIDWALAGAELANATDDEQAEFSNSMAAEMLSWGTRHQAEMQVASFSMKFDEKAADLLGEIRPTD